MKITLISPPFGEYVEKSGGTLMKLARLDEIQKSEGLPIAPPVLEYLAALTERAAPDAEVELIDANREGLDVNSVEADLVGLTVLTPQSPWVYRTADRLRQRGQKVVLGGMHVTVLPEEGKSNADPLMSVEKREQAFLWLRAEGFSLKRVLSRLWSLKWKGFPMTQLTSAMIQIPMGRAFREIGAGNPYA